MHEYIAEHCEPGFAAGPPMDGPPVEEAAAAQPAKKPGPAPGKKKELGDPALHPSHLTAWSVDNPALTSNEVGVIIRVNTLDKVDTAEKQIVVAIQRLAYRLFTDQDAPELLHRVRGFLGGSRSGVCPWAMVKEYCPHFHFRKLVSEPIFTSEIAWVAANDAFSKLTITFEQDMKIELRDPAPAPFFPFDWHHYTLDLAMETTQDCPAGILRGKVDDSAGFGFKRWAAKAKPGSMQSKRAILRRGDPFHDHWSYVDRTEERARLMKHSTMRIDKEHAADWKLYIHRNLDTEESTDPWPYWLSTEDTDGQGLAASLQLRFWMQRRPNLYIYNALLPLCLVELLALFSFCVEQEDLGSRERLLSTLMVSVYAIRVCSGQATPNVGYVTMYDVKFFLTMVFLLLVFVLQHLYTFVSEGFLHDDTVAIVVASVCGVLANLLYWIPALREYYDPPEQGIVCPVYNHKAIQKH